MKKTLCQVLRNEANLSNFRLTFSETELEFWEYSHGFLEHAREARARGERSPKDHRRKDNLNSVRNSVRRLVNANVNRYGYNPCFLTFTYRENQSDVSLAWSDWHDFMRKMRGRFGTLHALSVMEFQKRGAVHFHCIFFNLSPEVERTERSTRLIASLWGHGYVDIERVRSARNVGAYVCKYLNKSADDERLRGQKFYTTTRNLFRPIEFTGDVAKSRMLDILVSSEVELLQETTYEYMGAPVIYRNYKRVKNKE